ncbi:MAG: asparagine synthase (glutamine-hydrolyzing) [Oligoflexia bacterium]|nr:asparagine synthase (glutamine-hydrolyzing) [Oligoflexia bacterium]
MCGISGIIKSDIVIEDDLYLVHKMTDSLKHRGPDSSNVIRLSQNVIFGHNRLAIIDLDPRANQPMCFNDPTNEIWIVFNGEVYNYLSLKNDLLKDGRSFKSNSDTEVILHAYDKWGIDAISKLNGMFSLAIYDNKKQEIILARDRIGKKPLYYLITDKLMVFASEMKAFYQLKDFIPNEIGIDPTAVEYYFSLGYIPGDMSIIKGIKKLPAAHILSLDIKKWRHTIERYWKVEIDLSGHNCSKELSTKDSFELEEKFENLIEDSVKIRLHSDVPIGSFLSGGIDSTLVSYVASKYIDKLKTYSIGFNHEKLNELHFAKEVSSLISSDHTEFIVDINETKEILEDLFCAFDEPFADTSMIPTLWVSKLAKRNVTVALTGDGGDELFGGYGNYYFKRYILNGIIPANCKKVIKKIAHSIPENFPGKYFIQGFSYDKIDAFTNTHTLFKIEDRAKYLCLDVNTKAKTTPENYFKSFASFDNDFLNFSYLDLNIYLCDDLLVKVDRASMINSLEARSPLLDYRIVEFAFSELRTRLKNVGGIKKFLLKNYLRKNLSEEYFQENRNRKYGFGIHNVLQNWFKKGCMLSNEYEELVNSIDDELVVKKEALNLLKRFQTSNAYIDKFMASRKLFVIYAYFKWKERWCNFYN